MVGAAALAPVADRGRSRLHNRRPRVPRRPGRWAARVGGRVGVGVHGCHEPFPRRGDGPDRRQRRQHHRNHCAGQHEHRPGRHRVRPGDDRRRRSAPGRGGDHRRADGCHERAGPVCADRRSTRSDDYRPPGVGGHRVRLHRGRSCPLRARALRRAGDSGQSGRVQRGEMGQHPVAGRSDGGEHDRVRHQGRVGPGDLRLEGATGERDRCGERHLRPGGADR